MTDAPQTTLAEQELAKRLAEMQAEDIAAARARGVVAVEKPPLGPRKDTTDALVDYVARAILATWTDSMEDDWTDELVRDNRRIEARAAVKAIREWESVHGKL